MTVNLQPLVDENLKADIQTRIDKCPIRHILPYLKINGGSVEQVLVVENGLDLAEFAAFGVGTNLDAGEINRIIDDLREDGQVKMIVPFGIKPEYRKYGYEWSEIDPQSAIECFQTQELYYIRFLGFIWS